MICKLFPMIFLVLGSCHIVNYKQVQPLNTTNSSETKTMRSVSEQENYIEMSEPALTGFKSKLIKIKIGDTKEQVINLLGTPTYERGVSKKESDRILYYSLDYFVKKREEKNFSEAEDKLVTIYFTTNWKVRELSTNIEGVKNIPRIYN